MQKAILKQEDAAEIYEDIKLLIKKIIWKFIKQYGGIFDELEGEANYTFVKAYKMYNRKDIKFTTYLQKSIWNSLLNFRFKDPIFKNIKNNAEEILSIIPIKKSKFSIVDFIDELTEDSKTILALIFDMPNDLQTTIKIECIEKGNKNKKIKSCISKYLSDKIGWTDRQIKTSFNEIAEII